MVALVALAVAGLAELPAGARPRGPEVLDAPGTSAPAFVSGIREGVREGTAVQAARAHLRARPGLYGISDVGRDLAVLDVIRGQDTATVRFGQTFNGVPVWGAHYLVHLERRDDGFTARSVNGDYFTELDAPVLPRLQPSEAEKLAAARFALIDLQKIDSHGLTVLPFGEGALCYHLTLWGEKLGSPSKTEVFVNALTGAITLSYGNLQHVGPTTGTGERANGDSVTLQIFEGTDRFQLRDRSRPMFDPQTELGEITTHDARGRDDYAGFSGNLVKSESRDFFGKHSNTGAVDAHWGAGETYEFFRALGRDSIDDDGMTIVSTVNATEGGGPMYNAFWDGSQMVYGNPDPQEYRPFSAGLDIVAHELTHGVTEFSNGLVYLTESGALNEAYSDYFGGAVELAAEGTSMSDPGAGEIGEDLCKDATPDIFPCPLRDMNDGRTVDSYYYELMDAVGDNGGVHDNSTIFSGALWDARESIGEEMDGFVYKAITEFVTPLSDFVDGRAQVREAAAASGAEPDELQAIDDAFDAKGIVDGWDTSAPVDSRILRANAYPIVFQVIPPEASKNRWVLADFEDAAAAEDDFYNAPLDIWVGKIDGSGSTERASRGSGTRTLNNETPDISGRRVVWAHVAFEEFGVDIDIDLRNLRTGKIQKITSGFNFQVRPAIDGKLVAWEEIGFLGTDIKAKVLGRKSRKLSGRGEQTHPDVSGNWVAWWDTGSGGRPPRIKLANFKTGRRPTIALPRSNRRGFIGPPALGGERVFWFQDADGDGVGAIMKAKLNGKNKKALVAEGSPDAPESLLIEPPVLAANGRFVVFADESAFAQEFGEGPDVPNDQVGRDLWIVPVSGGPPQRVSENRGDQGYQAIGSGRKVVWLDAARGQVDLMSNVP